MDQLETSCPHLVQHGLKFNIKVLVDIHRKVESDTPELTRNYHITPSSFLPAPGVPGELPCLPGQGASSLVLSWSRYLLVHRKRKDPSLGWGNRCGLPEDLATQAYGIFSSSSTVGEHLTNVEFKNQTILKKHKDRLYRVTQYSGNFVLLHLNRHCDKRAFVCLVRPWSVISDACKYLASV